MLPPRIARLIALLVLLLCCLTLFWFQHKRRELRSSTSGATNLISPELLARFNAIETRERQVDETIWAEERRAEEYGATFDALWDQLNRSSNKFEVLAAFPLGELVVGRYTTPEVLAHGIEAWRANESQPAWPRQQWQACLAEAERAGWRLEQLEFRHRGFDPRQNDKAPSSRIAFRADLINANGLERASFEGDLLVGWTPEGPLTQPAVARLDASHLTIRTRRGAPPFQPILSETIQPPENWLLNDPLILYDLDGDGLSEIVLAGKNLVYRAQANGQYQASVLCKWAPGRIFTAVIADFDGDGFADLVCVKPEGLYLFKGSSKGTFDEPGRLVWGANPPIKYGQVLTCGDIDGDGDLDLFLGQYKSPYFHGQMPTPYYDANDGDPSYLLINDGKGNFTDGTESSGLARKRWRRSYSGSLVRLEGDDHLDLVVVSDFSGLDLYRNDGYGHFTDVTQQWCSDPHALGMAHALSDFNSDGRLDLLVIGMDSPTVDRIDHLGVRRSDVKEDRLARSRLAAGNRLLLARPEGGFDVTPLNDSISHSGWSWGCSAFDFDNDGFPDVYIANGHESRESVHDYEPEYWLHDVYVAGSSNDRATDLYFLSKFARTRGRGQSYAGYEHNRLYLNISGRAFFEVGHLMGVALEQDCRNVVADDLDGDGRVDLLVTTFEVWPQAKQTLRVYRNTLPKPGNWIGFRFREQGRGRSPVGTSVTVQYEGHTSTRQIVTGDSYRCQSPNSLHFGLGDASEVSLAEVRWTDGTRTRIERPKINCYHRITRE